MPSLTLGAIGASSHRSAVIDALRRELARLGRFPGFIAVLFLQLGGPNPLRDSFGDRGAEAVLVEATRRIRAGLRDFDWSAPWSDDAFVVHFLSPDEAAAVTVARRVVDGVAPPIFLGEAICTFELAVGLAVSSRPWTSPEALLAAAANSLPRSVLNGGPPAGTCRDEIVVIEDSRLRGEGPASHSRVRQEGPNLAFLAFGTLTRSEARVMRGLMSGRSAAQLAGEHHVSIATIRSQIKAILHKLSVNSQLAAVALAGQEGWKGGV